MNQRVEIVEAEALYEGSQVVELSFEELVAVAGGYGDSGHLA